MSEEAEAGWPAMISGATYEIVPTISPGEVIVAGSSRGLAMPKSASRILPPGSIIRLAGLMSRWTIPFSWA